MGTPSSRLAAACSQRQKTKPACGGKRYDGRSLAGRRRLQSRRKATDVMVELIHSAQRAGITAKFVLFDSWFSAPKTILELKKQEHLDTIAMMKKARQNTDTRVKGSMSKRSTAATRSGGDVPAIFCPYLWRSKRMGKASLQSWYSSAIRANGRTGWYW